VDSLVQHQHRNRFTWALVAISLVGLVLLSLPTIALVIRASKATDVLDDPRARETLREALTLSISTSLISLLVIVLVGTPIAWVLARGQFPGGRVLDALIDLPIILPPAVAGIALLTAFGRRGLLGETFDRFGISIGFTMTAVVIAQIFVSAPFFIRTARAGFSRIDQSLEEAAADLGASPARVFWKITLPLSRASLVAGAVLAWARALGEFGATIMFAGNREGVTQTMPLAIYERFGAGDLPSALVLSAILLMTSIGFLVVVRWMGEPGSAR
jgi:molybdate transport system permease protein